MNLSSTIVLNKIPEQFYRPRTAVDRSEITRCEKITTEIFPKVEEGAKLIANTIEAEIKAAQTAGRECVLGLGTGQSLTPVFEELIRRHEEGLSFANVVVFNAYEYFPLKVGSKNSSLHKLHELFLDKVDIKACNIFSPDGTIGQDNVQAHCRTSRRLPTRAVLTSLCLASDAWATSRPTSLAAPSRAHRASSLPMPSLARR